jgi:hypothetical protein
MASARLDRSASTAAERRIRSGPREMTIGRLLRILRHGAGLTLEEAAIQGEVGMRRIRDLESGAADLNYLDGLLLAKAYLLCPTCFAKHVRRAASRGELSGVGPADPPGDVATDPAA